MSNDLQSFFCHSHNYTYLGRRISTRGADKGVREEVKQAMRRQAARDGVEPLDDLLQRFIVNEKNAILHSLIDP